MLVSASSLQRKSPMVPSRLLSTKSIPVHERLIFALDVPNSVVAKELVEKLDDAISFYKLGLELFMSGNYFELVEWLVDKKKKVFVDLKFFDVSETVSRAVRQLRDVGAAFATVHPTNDDLLRAVVKEKNGLKILVVTVLTSLSQSDMDDLGFKSDIKDIVLSRARRALQLGCDGVVSSGLEASMLRSQLGDQFLIVAPGIRPGENKLIADDQKRVVDLEEAFHNGADYVVVGRPIRNATDQRRTAQEYQQRIAAVFGPQPATS
jgi:orotidine-5'-phosphate decarboxylase